MKDRENERAGPKDGGGVGKKERGGHVIKRAREARPPRGVWTLKQGRVKVTSWCS